MSTERNILNKLREHHITNEGNLSLLVHAVCTANCFSNDMRHIHLHACGNEFEQIHTLCQGYYEKASEDLDTLAEITLEYTESIPNLSYSRDVCNWDPLDESAYTLGNVFDIIKLKIEQYVLVLSDMYTSANITEDIKGVLDEMIRFWSKESNYKIDRKLMCGYSDTDVCVVSVQDEIV